MVNRRKSLQTLAAAAVAATAIPAAPPAATQPIQLHVDLEVDPAKTAALEANFKKVFRPTISKQPGFVDVRLLKFRKAMVGEGPKTSFYRLLISFQTEEQRVTWVATADHQKAWPTIEGLLKGAKFGAWLYDTV